MIPFVAAVRIQRCHGAGRVWRFWIPLALIWLLLLPVAVLLLPLVLLYGIIARVNTFSILATLFRVLAATSGTDVDVDAGGSTFSVRVF